MTYTTDKTQVVPPRSRWIVLPGVILAAGAIAIRFAPDFVMMILRTYGDDVLVAIAAYLFVGAACWRLAGWKVLLLTLALTWGFQVAELFHPAWMGTYWAQLRFEWSDIASFTVGALIGFGAEKVIKVLTHPTTK